MNTFRAPLYEALVKHASNKPASFHVPGHHYGYALERLSIEEPSMRTLVKRYKTIMELDVTELASTDDLHHPESSIKEALQLAATCFGAEDTFFLVGGSTSGNLALLLAVCNPGDLLIVQRNVHKSVINGLKLAGASAVFLTPEIDEQTGLATVPSVEEIEAALKRYPQAKAVFLTNPNYYGMGVKLGPYAEAAHRYSIPLLVDEAHGAHYGFHPDLPESALAAGADAVVQSTHKTLPALTMGAMLHVQGELIDWERLREILAMIQSSSPSFPIMASLDISRAMIDLSGVSLFQSVLDSVQAFKRWMQEQDLFIQAVAWPNREIEMIEQKQYDPLRVLLYDRTGQLTGYELLKELEQYDCWAEMADTTYVVLIFGLSSDGEPIRKLKEALIGMERARKAFSLSGIHMTIGKQHQLHSIITNHAQEKHIGEPVPFGRNLDKDKRRQRVPLRQAEGLQSAEMIVPYPPGIPLVYPGEYLSAAILQQLDSLAAAGAKFQGGKDARLSTIEVYIEK